MRLADLERTEDRDFQRFITRVPDTSGAEEFEFRVAGPGELVERMLGDATIELTINSANDDDAPVSPEFQSARRENRRAMWELAAFDDIDQLLKPSPPAPERERSVFASLRPASGHGTQFDLA
jgi:hypothetical protein